MTQPRVIVVPEPFGQGIRVCARCDRGSTRVILLDGSPWATACRGHLPALALEAGHQKKPTHTT